MQTDVPPPDPATPPATTAYVAEASWLAQWLRRGAVDRRSFERPLRRCGLAQCRGMCCYTGAALQRASARVLESLVQTEADALAGLGAELPPGRVTRRRGPVWPFTVTVTRTRPHGFSSEVDGYPAHFADTACVFRLGDGRCSLQVLSERQGRHPWHYKPLVCVLQPIKLGTAPGVSLFLPTQATDPSRTARYPGYAVHAFCGRTCPGGAPGWQVLGPELAYLGALTGQDLLAGFA